MPRNAHSQRAGSHGLGGRDPLELVIDGCQLGVDGVEVAEHLGERAVGERVVEPLAAQPGPVLLGPGFLPSR